MSKHYQLGTIGTGTLSHDINRWWANVRGKEDPFLKIGETQVENKNSFWALKDISFNIEQGSAVGIIGKNGAGKSTLLKILSRVTSPTIGSVKVKGRIASLLEVGTGFHPELTGKENIFLNGAILGMTKNEIKSKLDEIISFSGIELHINTPVKRYSSGMYVRLAFAVAAHLEPEILIVDEVLAVGDAEFQRKCLGKMKDVSGEGRTVLFVSHNMTAISNLCNHGIVLTNGKMDFIGGVEKCINFYQQHSIEKSNTWISHKTQLDRPCIKSAQLILEGVQPHLKLTITVTVAKNEGIEKFNPAFIAFDINNSLGTTIMQAIPSINPFIGFNDSEEVYKFEIDLEGLIPDDYSVSIWIGPHNNETYNWQKDVLTFQVIQSPLIGRSFPHHYNNGFIVPSSRISK